MNEVTILMVENKNCPKCKSSKIFRQLLLNGEVINRLHFLGQKTKFTLTRQADIKIENEFLCCACCGLIWSNISPHDISEHINFFGSDKMKRLLETDT